MAPVSKSTCSSAPPPISGSARHSSVATSETNTPGCTSISASSLADHGRPWSQESPAPSAAVASREERARSFHDLRGGASYRVSAVGCLWSPSFAGHAAGLPLRSTAHEQGSALPADPPSVEESVAASATPPEPSRPHGHVEAGVVHARPALVI